MPLHAITDKSIPRPSAPVSAGILVHGYVGQRVDLSKNLIFVPLFAKELDTSIQLVSSANPNGTTDTAHERLKALEAHSPVAVRGTLKQRKPPKSGTGDPQRILDYEINVEDVICLNEFPKDIIIKEDTHFPPEQRHLQMRNDKTFREALIFRAQAARLCRDELAGQIFTEIETPVLFKSTPEGAREFLVPTRRKGLAYALPQSPQQYKQILMASGIPRYYQLAKCFRDEDLRADRQPEFTQLDMEMSFATGEDVIQVVERVIRRLWGQLLQGDPFPEQFPRLPYDDAMSRYGSDKPDIRLGMEISDVGHLLPTNLISKITSDPDPIVAAMKLSLSGDPSETRTFINDFMDGPQAKPFQENPQGAPGIFIVDTRKPLQGLQPFGFEAAERIEDLLQLDEGDLVVLQARKKAPHTGGSTPMGNLRLALHRAAVIGGYTPPPTGFKFLWITDFPLFSPISDPTEGQGGGAGLASTHHPFTSPKSAEDVDLLQRDPLKARGEHYDLVVNGVELGGGSRRIHDAKVQEFVMRDVLKMPPSRLQEFSHLLEVLRAGCPPHAGIALGFDRLVAVMLGRESIRDVIAFPKSGRGEDVLVGSPSPMREEALRTYNLKVVD
ncbi:MAG: hypothetical protein M1817_000142 [Caeruleum heppii]|nr:MAG: hypothetical protein M1817_000142 [Caeruleum heppii]